MQKTNYTVYWENKVKGTVDSLGIYETAELAMKSIHDWWDENNYNPHYVRIVGDFNKNEVVSIDYGSHHFFYHLVPTQMPKSTAQVFGLDAKQFHKKFKTNL